MIGLFSLQGSATDFARDAKSRPPGSLGKLIVILLDAILAPYITSTCYYSKLPPAAGREDLAHDMQH